MFDLIVIGGGPAGGSAAIIAARSGARVLLLERGRFPRHKVCGEFVSAESLGLLGELFDQRHAALLSDAIRIPRARLFLEGRTIETPVEPPAASIARFDLDAALWESATQAGVETRQQTVVQTVSGTGPFHLKTSADDVDARAVLNASGRWSNLNPVPAENGQPREKWIGLKGHFSEESPSASVDLYFCEGGYCGVQPVDLHDDASAGGRVNACAMVRAGVASTLPEVFAQHPALQERARNWQPLSEPVSTSPLLFRDPQPLRDHILQAGDAAGFVDPFVGDGISLALRSGALAARCLIPFFRGEISLPAATDHYRQSYASQLAPVFRASARIRRMLLLPRVVLAPALLLLERMPVVTRYLVSKTR
jgi:flavin-dependent dehydrogenase